MCIKKLTRDWDITWSTVEGELYVMAEAMKDL